MAMIAKAKTDGDKTSWDSVWFVGIIPMVIVVVAIALSFKHSLGVAPLAAGLPIIGISVFVGLYEDARDLRGALAGAFMMAWLFLFAMTFNATVRDILRHDPGPAQSTTPAASTGSTTAAGDQTDKAAAAKAETDELNIARSLADDFKTLGVFVFSFYFGGLALQKTAANVKGTGKDVDTQG
jgi:uncharacterized membrane protein